MESLAGDSPVKSNRHWAWDSKETWSKRRTNDYREEREKKTHAWSKGTILLSLVEKGKEKIKRNGGNFQKEIEAKVQNQGDMSLL